jgi:uncharacterized YccA/Bax inhibitor family protein
MAMRTGNPALNEKTFTEDEGGASLRALGGSSALQAGQAMTLDGTVGKSFFLLFLTTAAAMWTWRLYFVSGGGAEMMPWILGGGIGGFIIAMVTIFNKKIAHITAPLYAVAEGLFLGAISGQYEARFEGIVINAVGLTLLTFLALLVAYGTKLIKATENFKLGVFAATAGIALLYLISFGLSFFGIHIPYIHSSGPIGIAFSVFVVTLAALNLVLDFDFIESGVEQGAPKYMEWYAAFGLMVTLVWLYLEILRLLAKTRGGGRD